MTQRRLLYRLWGGLGAAAAAGAAVLQMMGAPPAPIAVVSDGRSALGEAAVARVPAGVAARLAAEAQVTAPTPGTIAAPDPTMLAAIVDQKGRMLPVIAPDGRTALHVYAASPVTVLPNQARLALLVDGMGLDRALSLSAITELPAPVSLAFSPYADDPAALAAAARARGHEMLVSLPMEPAGSPLDDEGDRALSAEADRQTNTRNLLWALSALQGYVGVTAAETGQSGEHLLADRFVMGGIARALASRGVMFVDPRPGAMKLPGLTEASASLVVDAEAALADQEAALTALAGIAVRDGQALGIVGPLRPATLARLIAWTRTLPGQGVVLVPVSDLARANPTQLSDADPDAGLAAP